MHKVTAQGVLKFSIAQQLRWINHLYGLLRENGDVVFFSVIFLTCGSTSKSIQSVIYRYVNCDWVLRQFF